MALKNLMARLQSRASDTPDILEKITGYHRKAPIREGCTSDTPDTPPFANTRAVGQIGPYGEAVNDPAQAVGRANNPALAVLATLAPEAMPDPDRWCWPHSGAMTGAEIDTFTQRLARFTDKGVNLEDAEALADKLVTRDREGNDRRLCLECTHMNGRQAMAWRCLNWQRAGMGTKSRNALLSAALSQQLQRCDGFSDGIC